MQNTCLCRKNHPRPDRKKIAHEGARRRNSVLSVPSCPLVGKSPLFLSEIPGFSDSAVRGSKCYNDAGGESHEIALETSWPPFGTAGEPGAFRWIAAGSGRREREQHLLSAQRCQRGAT